MCGSLVRWMLSTLSSDLFYRFKFVWCLHTFHSVRSGILMARKWIHFAFHFARSLPCSIFVQFIILLVDQRVHFMNYLQKYFYRCGDAIEEIINWMAFHLRQEWNDGDSTDSGSIGSLLTKSARCTNLIVLAVNEVIIPNLSMPSFP